MSIAERTKNLRALLADTRTRTILLLTLGVLVFAILIGWFILSRIGGDVDTEAQLTRVPGGIRSIPGGVEPTEQYAQLQEEENVRQAELAHETGRSAIPTVVRTQAVGEADILGMQEGEGGLGFTSLGMRERDGGVEKSLWLDELRRTGCSRETVENALNEGLNWNDVREVCSCEQLIQAGFSLTVLRSVCECEELVAVGVTAEQFRMANYVAGELRVCGFDACTLRNAGYTARELCDGGYTPGELRGAGYSEEQIAAGCRLPGGALAQALRDADCDLDTLRRARTAGMSAAEIRRISGCDVETLRAAGFTADELRAAGFTAAELANAGFAMEELAQAGFSEEELANIAGIEAVDCSPAVLRQLRAAGVSAREIREDLGCDLEALRAAGFTAAELKEAGFTAAELKRAGFSAKDLKDAGFSAAELREAGFSAEDLKGAGFSAAELNDAGFAAEELKNAGFSAAELKEAGFSPAELKAAGFSVEELKNAGFSAGDLKEAGFSPAELKNAGFSAAELKDAGLSARELREAGFSAADLKNAGFDAGELRDAGFNPEELKRAGFSAADLARAGFDAAELVQAGFSVEELARAGFSTRELQEAGFSPEALRLAGVTGIARVTGLPPGVEEMQTTTLPSISGDAASDARLEAILAQQAAQISEQQLQQDISQRQAAMLGQVNLLIANYGASPTQFYDVGIQVDENGVPQQPGVGPGTGTPGAPGEDMAGEEPGTSVIKAGDIIFGVLDTAINSDEPGPVLATIVSGRYKGARIIGSLTLPRDGQKVILSFNTMSLPDADRTISINAVAIDPDTARTALSSRTDNRYLQRYGALFASAFLEGFGGSFADVGTTIEVDGTTTIIRDAGRSARESAYAGLGTVGERWGNQIAPIFNRPPTVEVFAGTGIGILFTQDVVIQQQP